MLSGKVLVIIGGTSGMGLSAAKACSAAGGRLVIVGRDKRKLGQALDDIGEGIDGIAGDAADPATAEKAIAYAVQQYHAFDGLYHVAGGSGRKWGDGPLHEISEDAWNQTMELNLTALFYSNRAAARALLDQKRGGSILNLTSVLGMSPSPHYFSTHCYAAAKAAAMGLTRSAAAYYAPHNIRFNALAPALVDTPMAQRSVGNAEIMEFIRTKQPLEGGRVGMSSDLDAAVVYFLSDASKFVTGQILSIDGGWSVAEGQIPEQS